MEIMIGKNCDALKGFFYLEYFEKVVEPVNLLA